MKTTAVTILAFLVIAAYALAQGTIVWNEAVNGPFSNLAPSATPIGVFQVGTNSVIGAADATPNGPNWGVNDDFFTFSIPNGLQIASVFLTVDRRTWAWIGDPSFANQYGFVINPSNGDLVGQWGLTHLSSGGYGMYMSDNDLQSFPTFANYRLDFFVQNIPEPGVFSLLFLGLGLVGVRRWKSIRTHQR